MQNHHEITSTSKFWNQSVQFWYLHHPAYLPPSTLLLANHITLPGREIPGAGRVITLPKGHHPALSNLGILKEYSLLSLCADCYLRQGNGP